MLRPVQLVVLAVEGKTGFDSLIEEVTLMGSWDRVYIASGREAVSLLLYQCRTAIARRTE